MIESMVVGDNVMRSDDGDGFVDGNCDDEDDEGVGGDDGANADDNDHDYVIF